ncbi:DUF2061 domain-containing protein [Flagellimonas marinaquae]
MQKKLHQISLTYFEDNKRHLLKTLTWRLLASVDTFILSFFFTGSLNMGVRITLVEVLTKIVLYFVHEKLWFRLNLVHSVTRHLVKTISWRMLGTLDTMLLTWLITGDMFMGVNIGMTEVLSKSILYFFHERIWYASNIGLKSRKSKQQGKA